MASILVIDDDRAVLATVEIILKRAGHQVTAVNQGRVGIKLCQTQQFDLLIVDIFMPDMDGLETLSQVHQVHPDLPVIVISGYQFGSDRDARPDFLHMATSLGAVKGLAKPFRPAELMEAVSAGLERKMTSSHSKDSTAKPVPPS